MKYVIDDHDNVVLGSGPVFHKDLFRALGSGSRIKGAGHCVIQDGRVKVFDGSVGFGIESKPEDAKWIEAHLGIGRNEYKMPHWHDLFKELKRQHIDNLAKINGCFQLADLLNELSGVFSRFEKEHKI